MFRSQPALTLLLIGTFFLGGAGIGWGQIPAPKLWNLFPPGALSGGEAVVEVAGEDLGSADKLYFSHSGIKAVPATNPAAEVIAGAFQVTVSDEVESGVYEAWVGGSLGLSNSRLFVVARMDEVKDDTPGHSPEAAKVLPLGVVVNGRTKANQKNFYRVFLQQNQSISISCYGSEIDSKLEPAIELFDESGRLIMGERRGDPLHFSADATGPIFVAVSDLTYRGGNDFFYRLSIHSKPVVSMNLPFSGNPDTLETAYLFGFNLGSGKSVNDRWHCAVEQILLDDLRSTESVVTSLNQAAFHSFAALGINSPHWRLRDFGVDGVSQPFFEVSEQNTFLDFSEQATDGAVRELELPVRVSGVFGSAFSSGVYEFEATKGEVWWFEILSSRRGMATNPYLLVEFLDPDTGSTKHKVAEWSNPPRKLDRRAFPLRSRDPQGELVIKQTGRYRVTVADLFGVHDSPINSAYELRIRKPDPGVRGVFRIQSTLHKNVNRSVAVESATVLPGQVLPLTVLLERLDGYRGRVRIAVSEPVQGIEVKELTIAEGKTEGAILLEVSPGAELRATSLGFVATCLDREDSRSVPLTFGQIVWDVGDYNNESVVSRLSPHCLISVAQGNSTPVRLSLGQDGNHGWETALGGKVGIPIECIRSEGFSADYTFKLAGHEALLKHPGVSFAKGETKGEFVIDLAKTKLSVGKHRFYLHGEVKGNYQLPDGKEKKEVSLSVYSPAIELRVFPAPFELISPQQGLVLRPGRETTVSLELRRRFGFSGHVEVSTALNAPPAGVESWSSMLQNGRFDLSLTASEISKPKRFNVILKAKGVYNGQGVESELILPVEFEPVSE